MTQYTVLLHRHEKIGLVLPLGGYIEEGEIPEEAVIREVKEESGLDIQVIDSARTARAHNLNDGTWHQANPGMTLARIESRPGVVMLDFTFAAVCNDISALGTGEVNKEHFVFLDEEELKNYPDIKENVRYYGAQALRMAREI